MRTRVKDRKSTKKGKKNNTPLRRSLRLKMMAASLSTDRCTKAKIRQAKVTKNKVQKELQYSCKSDKKWRKKSVIQPSKELKQTRKISNINKSIQNSKEIKENGSITDTKGTTTKRLSSRGKPTIALKKKPHSINVNQSSKVKNEETRSDDSDLTQCESRIGKIQLLNKIRIELNSYGNASVIRFSDVAFLNDNHILALNDGLMSGTQGQRICCICLDGALVCDLLVPGYPWSVVVLSATEAAVSTRRLGSNGLLLISIDIDSKSMSIIRNIPLEAESYGLSYSDKSEIFVVSYYDQPYMSVLAREGEEIRKIPCVVGIHYKCLILEDNNILFLDNRTDTVSIIDQRGKVILTLKNTSIRSPNSLKTDCFGNIYVGNYRNGELLKFDKKGKYLATFQCVPNVCGVGIDRKSDRIVAASGDSLFVYKLNNNV